MYADPRLPAGRTLRSGSANSFLCTIKLAGNLARMKFLFFVSVLFLSGGIHAQEPAPATGDIESVEPAGRLIWECTLPGHTRRDDVVPRAANAIQLSATRWMVIYSTRGYRGVDDERSIIYQVRRDAPDGAVLKENFFAQGEMDWKLPGLPPLAEGNVYYKQ